MTFSYNFRVLIGGTQGALPFDPAKGSSTLWTPFRAIELTSLSYCFRVLIEVTQGALPLDPAKGSSTLWTPFRAIELISLSYCFRVFIQDNENDRTRFTAPFGRF